MSRRTTEQLVQELARDVAPVQPMPRIRTVFAVVLVAWLVAGFFDWRFGPLRRTAFAALPATDSGFLAVLIGLALMAVGAMLAALSSAIPGRDGDARLAAIAAGGGIGLAVGGGVWAVVASGGAGVGHQAVGAFSCMSHAGALGLLPVVMAVLFLARGAAHRPRVGAGLAVCGAVALGALVVHVSCLADGGLHMLLGHALAPLALGLALALPLAAVVRRWRRAD